MSSLNRRWVCTVDIDVNPDLTRQSREHMAVGPLLQKTFISASSKHSESTISGIRLCGALFCLNGQAVDVPVAPFGSHAATLLLVQQDVFDNVVRSSYAVQARTANAWHARFSEASLYEWQSGHATRCNT